MRAIRTVAGIVVGSALLVGCGGESGEDTQSGTTSAEDVANEAGEALDAASEYASQRKDEVMSKLQQQYEDLGRRIDELKTRAKNAGVEAEAELTKAMNNLELKRNQFEAQLKELRGASGDAWKDISEGASAAYGELEKAFEEAAESFKGSAGAGS